MRKILRITVVVVLTAIAGGALYSFSGPAPAPPAGASRVPKAAGFANAMLAAKFDHLSKNGNSSCSASFTASIRSMPDDARLRGSCCSPMSLHRYGEQVEGITKFKTGGGRNLAEIPDDPYDIEAALAKKLLSYYDVKLTREEQGRYDYAMKDSHEKGPCCCRCWRWQVYGGLAKFLIRNYGFSGKQIAQLWDLSDGCGGDDLHHHAEK